MLVVFDVDGTLIDGEAYDWKSFNDAFTEVTGRSFTIEFWKSLDEVTASAIVHQGLADLPENERAELELLVRDRCLENLRAERKRNPTAFGSSLATRELLQHLEAHDSIDLAIATGDWHKTIEFKLEAAEIELERYVHATSSDSPIRSNIIQIAANRSRRQLKDTIYVGDGVWDIRACRMLGIPFIGTGQRVDALKDAGAQWILEELETEALLDIVEQIGKARTNDKS
jgi:phosphoglycolate phosphatase-like HAD superfamily hydrolase